MNPGAVDGDLSDSNKREYEGYESSDELSGRRLDDYYTYDFSIFFKEIRNRKEISYTVAQNKRRKTELERKICMMYSMCINWCIKIN